MRPWIALFSRSGSEIVEISKRLGRWPIRIVTNKVDLSSINRELPLHLLTRLSPIPTISEYKSVLLHSALITLNGYLRIVPGEICNDYEIYNGHPGDIVAHPELRGKNPQEKAVQLGLETSGSVIHRATEILDDGKIEAIKSVSIKDLTLPQVMELLHQTSIDLWVNFLSERLK